MEQKEVTIKDMWQVLFQKEFYMGVMHIILICIPAVLIVLFFSIKIDRKLKSQFFINSPLSIGLFIVFCVLGISIIWRGYAYLVLIGKGSSYPPLGETKKLVTSGPYSLIRHPAMFANFFGIIGLGCLSRSTFFVLVVIPVLFICAVFYNRFIQEKGCLERFGDEYLEYRKIVPMVIPKVKKGMFKKLFKWRISD